MREASERRRFGAWRLVRVHEKRRLLMMTMGIGYNICIERNPSRKNKNRVRKRNRVCERDGAKRRDFEGKGEMGIG